MTTAAAIKAWETRRARAAGTAPLPQLKPVSADRSAAAHKAWETIRAKKAAQAATPITAPPPRPERVKVERITALTPPSSTIETAGQKAAATRKAIEEARVALRAVDTDSAILPGQSVSLWIKDSPHVGSGARVFIVQDIGPKTVDLYYPPLLREITVSRREFDAGATVVKTTAKQSLARIDRAAASYEACGLDYSARAARSVNRMIEEFFASGGTIKTIPAGQRTLDPPLTFGDIQKHHGLREVVAV